MKKNGDLDKHVGHLIRSRRLQLGLKQAQIADALGITQQQIVKFELGYSRVSSNRLSMIADVLGVETGYFFSGVGQNAVEGGKSGGQGLPTLVEALSRPDCVQLVKLFDSVKDKKVRRMIVDLVSSLAQAEATKAG